VREVLNFLMYMLPFLLTISPHPKHDCKHNKKLIMRVPQFTQNLEGSFYCLSIQMPNMTCKHNNRIIMYVQQLMHNLEINNIHGPLVTKVDCHAHSSNILCHWWDWICNLFTIIMSTIRIHQHSKKKLIHFQNEWFTKVVST
jgi:hypothetical protein